MQKDIRSMFGKRKHLEAFPQRNIQIDPDNNSDLIDRIRKYF